ncbi:hypothetical protein I6M48_01310 [Shewanella algae]|uniref:hypothetical protein n=1 Tax=Shewanella algae TaxID=38313 RepID=UPI001AAF2893|nr:hypothetical protein [Shewanella algae]MBO2631140.1 hypothetical protein [Shewanella algae]
MITAQTVININRNVPATPIIRSFWLRQHETYRDITTQLVDRDEQETAQRTNEVAKAYYDLWLNSAPGQPYSKR